MDKKTLLKRLNVDIAQLYLTRGAYLHPIVYTFLITSLVEMERKGKVSLIPFTILQKYNSKFKKSA